MDQFLALLPCHRGRQKPHAAMATLAHLALVSDVLLEPMCPMVPPDVHGRLCYTIDVVLRLGHDPGLVCSFLPQLLLESFGLRVDVAYDPRMLAYLTHLTALLWLQL